MSQLTRSLPPLALLVLALGCKIEEGTTPPVAPTTSPTPTGTPTATPTATTPPLPTGTATGPTAPQTATPTATTPPLPTGVATGPTAPPAKPDAGAPKADAGGATNTSGKCAADADCPTGQHCALGMPLNGKCWKNGTPEPMCLASDTRIATPKGEVLVRDITPGTEVWTLDKNGAKVAAKVGSVGNIPAPIGHQMVHVVMSDGRGVFASPKHPTCAAAKPGAATVADLARGSAFDRALVSTADRAPYTGTDTYDLLPEGDTGCYWANGVLLGSTLAPR